MWRLVRFELVMTQSFSARRCQFLTKVDIDIVATPRLRRDPFAFLSYAQSNSRFAPVGELNASGFENLTKASDGAGAYFFASLEANDCLASDPRGNR